VRALMRMMMMMRLNGVCTVLTCVLLQFVEMCESNLS
jgi:hypothetical protein